LPKIAKIPNYTISHKAREKYSSSDQETEQNDLDQLPLPLQVCQNINKKLLLQQKHL